jgi:hypothetical protein
LDRAGRRSPPSAVVLPFKKIGIIPVGIYPKGAASVWIGFDPREAAAFAVARESVRSSMSLRIPIHGIVLSDLKKKTLYRRPTERRLGRLYDVISDAPMSTEFAISRFLVPRLAQGLGWAVFMDCDVLVRRNIVTLLDSLDDQKAVYCVKHEYTPMLGVKMDNQAQQPYPRKNWSSVMIFNCEHPANKKLTVELINTVPGRDLHRFCWLEDDEIGALSPEWNWLVGEQENPGDPAIVHYTLGHPGLGFQFADLPFAEEWFHYLEHRWAA